MVRIKHAPDDFLGNVQPARQVNIADLLFCHGHCQREFGRGDEIQRDVMLALCFGRGRWHPFTGNVTAKRCYQAITQDLFAVFLYCLVSVP